MIYRMLLVSMVVLVCGVSLAVASADDGVCAQLDVTADGRVTPVDAVYVVNRVGQTVPPGDPAADLDGDGTITVADAEAALQRLENPLTCAMWIWTEWLDPAFENDQAARITHIDTVIDTLKGDGYNAAYMNVYRLVDLYPDTLTYFLHQAKLSGIEVELLAGDENWLDDFAPALELTQLVLDYVAANPDVDVTALHLDIEPQARADWTFQPPAEEGEDPPPPEINLETVATFLDLLSAIRDEVDRAEVELLLVFDVPFWFNNIYLTYDGTTQSLFEHVVEVADALTVLTYRDSAMGAGCITFSAEDVIDIANTAGIPIVIGLETKQLAAENDYVTFFEEGRATLAEERRLVDAEFWFDDAYTGIAIHEYDTWISLPEDTGIDPQCPSRFGS